VSDAEKARVMCCLAAIEVNMTECREVVGWWFQLGPGARHVWLEWQSQIRFYQHAVQNEKSRGSSPPSVG
jgi:hypothetical protein